MTFLRTSSRPSLLFKHDLFGKPIPTFPDHAPPPLVARFGPEWNSPKDNKTRFFNILGVIDDSGCTVLLHSAGSNGFLSHRPARSLTREVGQNAPSRGRFRRKPLIEQQIELRRPADQTGQEPVDLAAMVGLVVEPMGQRKRELLL